MLLFTPAVCNKVVGVDAEGVNVICPVELEEPAVNGVPSIVIPVIAALHVASSVKVTLNGTSTVAPAAAVKVGGAEPDAVTVKIN